jgi:pyruvate dehydrogenase E2 component (dihydrolipoamide acetyltransferase)
MPRQGQSVESCVILEWHKKKGEKVAEGDLLFTYETDKASFEHESPVSGTLLDVFFDTDADVPVLTNVAVIGEPGEGVDEFRPGEGAVAVAAPAEKPASQPAPQPATAPAPVAAPAETPSAAPPGGEKVRISPRARKLAEAKGVETAALGGSGPKGRIIERDVAQRAAAAPMSRTAQDKAGREGLSAPSSGTGLGGRILARDLVAAASTPAAAACAGLEDGYTDVKLPQIRKIIGERMMQSLQQSAQLTLHATANASALLAYRGQVKKMGEEMGLANITITDLVACALTRVLPRFPEVNALFRGDAVRQYEHVHLAMAVDTPRGLMVPVVRFADLLPLNELAKALKQMARECVEGSINPDLLAGGTITLSNLGGFGVEYFTPVLNPPQVALLGVNTISRKPVAGPDNSLVLAPHIGLSLTIDHRAVDGAPGARFLKALVAAIENINLTLSL